MRAITTKEGEIFPHRYLWQCAKSHQEYAENIMNGRKSFDLSTMLLAYFTYEAYLNFVGDRFDPGVWNKEKEFFNQKDYYGIEGKLKRISEKAGNFELNKSRRPYQTIRLLVRFRSSVVHGKILKYNESIEHHKDHKPDLWPKDAFEFVTSNNASKAIQDVEEFIEYIHLEVKPYVKDIWFGDKALKGPIGHASSSTDVKI